MTGVVLKPTPVFPPGLETKLVAVPDKEGQETSEPATTNCHGWCLYASLICCFSARATLQLLSHARCGPLQLIHFGALSFLLGHAGSPPLCWGSLQKPHFSLLVHVLALCP